MRIIGKLLLWPLLLVNILISGLTIFSCYISQMAPFGKYPIASLSGLAFPYFGTALLVFLVFWLCVWKKAALLPAVTIIACIGPIWDFSPLHLHAGQQPPGTSSLKLMTYNTKSFGVAENGDKTHTNPILTLAAGSGADIICMQEALPSYLHDFTAGKGTLKEYPYVAAGQGTASQTIISRHRILASDCRNFENGSGNSYQHALIKIGSDTISVYNCHFQSNHLDNTNLEDYNNILHNPSDTSNYHGVKNILKKLLDSTSQRAQQAEMISAMVKADRHKFIIVCGDFNDSPLSYAHKLFDRFMTDAWAKCGKGPGITYNSHNLYYRIDHIFCSRKMQPYAIRKDQTCKDSDHYPVICDIAY